MGPLVEGKRVRGRSSCRNKHKRGRLETGERGGNPGNSRELLSLDAPFEGLRRLRVLVHAESWAVGNGHFTFAMTTCGSLLSGFWSTEHGAGSAEQGEDER